MPHSIDIEQPTKSPRASNPKAKASSSRDIQHLHTLYSISRNRYQESNLSTSITQLLTSKTRPAITKLVSLGLGTLHLKSADQTRRIKQLTIFLAIAAQLRRSEPAADLHLYAQDPSFSKTDQAFLQSLGVHILRTPSATELGEAAQYIDETTLVYSPFLTLEAYQLLFATGAVNLFIGDDFDALRAKWPKRSSGRNEAELLLRRFVQGYRKRVVGGDEDGFWDVEDRPFPMAMYSGVLRRFQSKQPRAKL